MSQVGTVKHQFTVTPRGSGFEPNPKEELALGIVDCVDRMMDQLQKLDGVKSGPDALTDFTDSDNATGYVSAKFAGETGEGAQRGPYDVRYAYDPNTGEHKDLLYESANVTSAFTHDEKTSVYYYAVNAEGTLYEVRTIPGNPTVLMFETPVPAGQNPVDLIPKG
ncbi:MAG: hypothetical protein AB1758_09865 [Candidatus Eremiobacterota bacterium]